MTGWSPQGFRFPGLPVRLRLCLIQIVVSFKASNEVRAIRAESKFYVYSANVSADSFEGNLLYSCRRDFASKATRQLYIYEFTICRIEFYCNSILYVGKLDCIEGHVANQG